MELLRERLIECGWKDEMKVLCRFLLFTTIFTVSFVSSYCLNFELPLIHSIKFVFLFLKRKHSVNRPPTPDAVEDQGKEPTLQEIINIKVFFFFFIIISDFLGVFIYLFTMI